MAKTKRIYRANERAGFDDSVAEWIGEMIEANGGEITPDQLVEAARPTKSPGHKLFPWSDREAAEIARKIIAQQHLRMIQIEVVVSGEKQRVRAAYPVFFADRDSGARRSHVSYDRIQATPDLARQVIESAAHEVLAWQRRYALYRNVFGEVFSSISKLEESLWPPKSKTESRKSSRRTVKANRQSSRKTRSRKKSGR